MNHRHQVFITQMLLHGDKDTAYSMAYPKAQGRSIEVGANRLLNIPEISEVLERSQERMRKKLEKEIIEQKKAEVLNVERMKELLTQMAEGTLETPRHLRTKEGYDLVQEKPAHWHILRAIYTFCRITGQFKQAEKEVMREEPQELSISFDGIDFPEYFSLQKLVNYADEGDEEYGMNLKPKHPHYKEKFFVYQQKRAAKRDAMRNTMTAKELQAEQEALKEFSSRQADDNYLVAEYVPDMLWNVYVYDRTDENLRHYHAVVKLLGFAYLPHRHRWQAENEAGWEFHPADIQRIRKKARPFSTINHNKSQDFKNGKAA